MISGRSALGVLGMWLLAGSAAIASPDAYEATRGRPLFAPSRRPPPPIAGTGALPIPTAPVPPPAPPPDVAVSGIIIGEGAGMALVRRPADATATRVMVGSRVDGWTVVDIRPRAIVLRLDDRSVTITLPQPGP